ncbi:plasmid pRiA4b ORF-3 family protein [Subsaximicrobium wynnwilliamsii]|uniref:Plasmid pRiA4b ORF-3 family protein n=1 Tax=Subsaximicrobium wynnwilliamsii TaxID=291179 RepID=A0A5C6ZLD5_9FLAO|nr:plasmid pRiA4b ORF-3 family protein [Subsaximicrobium wynnwilliamsii]TXD84958.1 plasmid pRiA4b ORF-3 family protein [Subsaximicrobium wynnwilliamsii]TXD90629.1 plasmid pRiA4b ORF-3 family protein [Subsaximicrobium wynnwilliamsii]TXE05103.1 plasmid pRiA4b ORF-3 family protein [Subsaximicrobium wynnwilliamsii]
MIYKFRILLDSEAEDDVFRDIEIRETDTLEDLHNAITQSFGFDGIEMASFYVSNEQWDQGEEISMIDVNDTYDDKRTMSETALNDVVNKKQTKLIYVYDFLSMWTFLVELADVAEEAEGTDYPNLMFAHGQIPDTAPEKSFEAENFDDEFDEFNDDLDIDDYEDLDFDENWN